jgi:predicted  nucleic acid-binding Zn-ribbon protein
MATTETTTTIEDQLRALIRLQLIDSRIDQINKLQGDLPDEIRDLEDEKAGLETRIENAKREAQESEVQRKKFKLDVAESEGLIRKYEEQQLQVRNNREYDALTKEIEAQRQRVQQAHDTIEELTTRDSTNVEAVTAAEERLTELAALLKEKRAELDQVVADTKAEQDEYAIQREAAAATIDERYLRAYERLRSRMRDGRAVVPIERGAAAGYLVPPQRQVEIRQRDRIIVSEHDGRIVVDDQLYREVTGEIEA